jgi:hypothetical protein
MSRTWKQFVPPPVRGRSYDQSQWYMANLPTSVGAAPVAPVPNLPVYQQPTQPTQRLPRCGRLCHVVWSLLYVIWSLLHVMCWALVELVADKFQMQGHFSLLCVAVFVYLHRERIGRWTASLVSSHFLICSVSIIGCLLVFLFVRNEASWHHKYKQDMKDTRIEYNRYIDELNANCTRDIANAATTPVLVNVCGGAIRNGTPLTTTNEVPLARAPLLNLSYVSDASPTADDYTEAITSLFLNSSFVPVTYEAFGAVCNLASIAKETVVSISNVPNNVLNGTLNYAERTISYAQDVVELGWKTVSLGIFSLLTFIFGRLALHGPWLASRAVRLP